jgi:hypothetical protein
MSSSLTVRGSVLLLCAWVNVACGSDGASSPAAIGGASNGGNTATGAGGAGNTTSTGGANTAGTNAGGASVGGASVGGMSAGGASVGGASVGGASANGAGKFLPSSVFYQDISNAAVDSESATVMAALQASGWGDAGKRTTLGVDFSFEVNQADASVARRAFTEPADAQPDCDTAPIPLPAGGKTEGTDDYACSGGDCHLLVYQGTRLYELYQSNVTTGMATGGQFSGSCLVVWDLTRDYWQPMAPPNFSRGDGCNGADAGDFPIAPVLLTADELAAKQVLHAMRFTISNNRIRAAVYVHPMTHIGGPTGGPDTLPYGARLRLRADYDLTTLPNDAARAVAKALQTYGMFLADGGNIYISATTEASSAISGGDMGALMPNDFEMIDGGTRINWEAQNCTRTPVTD